MFGIHGKFFATRPLFFRYPHPGVLVGCLIGSGPLRTHLRSLMAQQPRPGDHCFCPSVVESRHFSNVLRHYNQRNHQNRAKSPLERNIIFILLRSSLHGLNPSPIRPAKHDAHFRRRFFRSRRCQVVDGYQRLCKRLLFVRRLAGQRPAFRVELLQKVRPLIVCILPLLSP